MWEFIFFVSGVVYVIVGVLLGAFMDDRLNNCVTRHLTSEWLAVVTLFLWPLFFLYCYIDWQVRQWVNIDSKRIDEHGRL